MTDCNAMLSALAVNLLKTSPVDLNQRAINHFDLRPYCYLTNLVITCCSGSFQFTDFCSVSDSKPFGDLPVLYTSSSYTSKKYVPLNYPIPLRDKTEYWIGPTLNSSNAVPNAMEILSPNSRIFYACCNQFGGWNDGAATPFYRSASNTVLSYYQTGLITSRTGSSTTQLGATADYNVTDLQISGNGSTFFKLSKDVANVWSWYRWNKNTWESMNSSLAIGYSYDGQYACSAIWSGSFLYVYAYNSASLPIWRAGLLAKESDGFIPHLAMIGEVVFLALGKTIYSIGSNLSAYKIKTPTVDVCTGIWTDDSTIWVAAGNMSYMSCDKGWTWIEQLGVRAVSRGMYIRSLSMVISDPTRFQDDVQYPLKLNNRGLLRSFDGDWQNAFELKNGEYDYTLIDCDTRYATSPNGLFLLDNNMEGDVVLYFNVWRTAQFSAWRSSNRSITCRGYDNYCELMQDDNCIVGIPPIGGGGGDDGKDPGDDDPPPSTPTSDPPKKPLPIGLIIGAVALGLLLIIGVIWVATRKVS